MAFLDKMFFLGFVFMMIVGFVGTTYQHEMAHIYYNEKYGIESEWVFNLPWTVGIQSYEVQPDNLKLMHSINEAVGYNTAPFFMAILCLIGFGFWYIGNKMDDMFDEFKRKGITIQQLPPQTIELEGVDWV